jgi:hypothetical protein
VLLRGIYAPCVVLASRLARASCGATAAERGGRYPQDFMPHEAADGRLIVLRHQDPFPAPTRTGNAYGTVDHAIYRRSLATRRFLATNLRHIGYLLA